MRIGAGRLSVLLLLVTAGCWDWDGLGDAYQPSPDLGVEVDLEPVLDLSQLTCNADASDPCAGRSCGEAVGPCGNTVACGTCPGVCGGDDAGSGTCACNAGDRLGVNRLAVDVNPGAEGWYHCYAPSRPPDAGEPRAPSPCEGFHTLQQAGAFFVYPTAGASDSGLVPLYWCSATFRHFLTTDATCADLKQINLVQTGILGYIATAPKCGAVALHRLAEVQFDNDRAYVVTKADIDFATMSPSGYDAGLPYVEEGVIGYLWTTP